MKFSILPAILVAAATAGCHSSTEPFNLGSVYVLESIAGNSLPAEYAANPDFHARMLADTLVLAADGTGEWRAWTDNNEPGGTLRAETSPITYERDGNRIAISFVCPNNGLADCVAPPHFVGSVGVARISINLSVVTRQPLVFRLAVK